MSEDFAPAPSLKLSSTQWLICFIAAIGFAFDIYELLMLPLIVRPALQELVGAAPGTPDFQMWVGRLFYIPAFAGGIFGLVGGYLTDRLGRRRVLTWSILIYAFSAFLAGFSTSIWMLLTCRCLVFIGVCVEFVAAVAWLAELFPDPHQREKVLGYTQAFSSIGGLLVAIANGLAISHGQSFPAIESFLGETISDPHAPWRYTLMSGVIPALPLIIIRPFLPESPVWAQKKESGTLKRPSIAQLFAPELCRTTLITTVMFACSFGAAFGAIQQIPQIVPGLPEVKERVNAALAEPAVADKVKARLESSEFQSLLEGKSEAEQKKLTAAERGKIEGPIRGRIVQEIAANVTKVQEVGGLVGRFALAMLAVMIVERRKLLRVFQVPGLLLMPVIFAYCATTSLSLTYVGLFVAGFVTVAQFSFWGNYLPRVYPLHLRGTGESFAANIGGRLIGTSFAWVTATLAATDDVANAPLKLAYTAAAVGFGVYLVGFIASFWLPEPPREELS
jgi:MFS family permease